MQELLEQAIDSCYEAVTAPELWPNALQDLAYAVDASCAMLYPKDVGTGAMSVPASREYEGFLEEYVRGNWFDNHYRAERGWPLLNSRRVVIEHDLATDEERKTIRVYNELYLRWGYTGFAMVGCRIDGHLWAVPFLRSKKQKEGFFTREEAAGLASLHPHMRRWITLMTKFDALRLTSGIEALNKLGCAAVLIGRLGQVEAVNASAEALLARVSSPLLLKGGHLYASDSASDRRLRALIAAALAPEAGTSRGTDAMPTLVEQPGQLPLAIEAVSVSGIVSAMSTRARTILLITDLSEKRNAREDRLRATFGLTPAEANLASALAGGEDLRSAAKRKSVSYETARVQLKSIFDKTGARRQAELVGLISRLR